MADGGESLWIPPGFAPGYLQGGSTPIGHRRAGHSLERPHPGDRVAF
jgi:hypothetical protein